MNALCGTFALGAVGGVGFLIHASREEPDVSRRLQMDRFHVLLDRARNAEAPDAEAIYAEALRERPKSVLVRLELARLFEARGDDARALRQYASFVEPSLQAGVRPLGDSDTLVRYGELCLRRGDAAGARRAFRMGATPAGVDPAWVGAPARERLWQEARAATTQAFRRLAVRADATTQELAAGAHLVAGRGGGMLATMGARREAVAAHCRRAVELAPGSALSHCLLAVTLHGQGSPKAAGELALARRLARGDERIVVERWAAALRARGPASG